MELSIFLAKVMGLYLLIVPAAVLLNRKHFPKLVKDFSENSALLVLSGFVAVVLGLLIVVGHNVWSADWRVIITILGWLTLAKGLVRILLPTRLPTFGIDVAGAGWILLLVLLFGLGVYLTYVGFSSPVQPGASFGFQWLAGR